MNSCRGINAEAECPWAGPVALEPAQIGLFLTDGILEASPRNGMCFGVQRVSEVVNANRHESAHAIAELICHAAREFSHDLKPGGVAEECLRLPAGRSRAFEWSASAPVDFNIHYHQGEKVTYPVMANQQREGKGRFTASAGEDYCWMWSARGPTKVTGRLGPEE